MNEIKTNEDLAKAYLSFLKTAKSDLFPYLDIKNVIKAIREYSESLVEYHKEKGNFDNLKMIGGIENTIKKELSSILLVGLPKAIEKYLDEDTKSISKEPFPKPYVDPIADYDKYGFEAEESFQKSFEEFY
jgi:hypothetical protein